MGQSLTPALTRSVQRCVGIADCKSKDESRNWFLAHKPVALYLISILIRGSTASRPFGKFALTNSDLDC
jgi:hypothetical protein